MTACAELTSKIYITFFDNVMYFNSNISGCGEGEVGEKSRERILSCNWGR